MEFSDRYAPGSRCWAVAAREAPCSKHLIHPRSRGRREALRVLMSTRASAVVARTRAIHHLKALIVAAPEDL